jgi:hypothetical protein
MTDKEKADLTRTEVGRMLGSEIEKLKAAQAARDAEQDAKLPRPSTAIEVMKARADITLRYPVPCAIAGLAFIASGVYWFEGAKMWTLVVIGTSLVPGLASKAIDLVSGLKKAKGE